MSSTKGTPLLGYATNKKYVSDQNDTSKVILQESDGDKNKRQTASFKSFNYLENGQVTYSIFDTIKSASSLDPGIYKLEFDPDARPKVILSSLENSESVKIFSFDAKPRLDEVFNAFFSKNVRCKINKLGFTHKLGVLLYGKEGTGKTTITRYYSDIAIREYNAIVFFIGQAYGLEAKWNFIFELRKIQDNPIVVVFEECDALMDTREEEIKVALDGHASIDNCICYLTTNYIDKIPNAIKNRPSRIKDCIEICGVTDIEVIKSILSPMIDDICDDNKISEYANDLKNSTLDEIKQFGLDKIMDLTESKVAKKKIGFNNDNKKNNL